MCHLYSVTIEASGKLYLTVLAYFGSLTQIGYQSPYRQSAKLAAM